MILDSVIASDSRLFFDLKKELKSELENYEAKVYNEKDDFVKIRDYLDKLNTIIETHDSEYFRLRVKTLNALLNRLIEKRKYRKIDFDRIHKILDKIRESDSVEFLNEALKNRIERISEKLVASKKKEEEKYDDAFYLFTHKSLHFVVREHPKKILYDVDATKNFIKYKGKRYPIFPVFHPMESFPVEFCNLLILKAKSGIKCYRFDSLEKLEELTAASLYKMLKNLDEPMGEIKSYIRWKGKRVYFIEL